MSADPFQARLRATLDSTGALLSDGHFVLNGGDHSAYYLRKDELTTRPRTLDFLSSPLAGRFRDANVSVVVGPAVGAISMAERVAAYIGGIGGDVRAVWAEKRGRGFVLKRGFDRIVRGARVLVVEDVLTTGGSIRRLIACIRRAGGQVVGVAAFFDRGGLTAEALGVPRLETLMRLDLPRHPEAACPLCEAGIPVDERFGHGAAFNARRSPKP
jgi:orotate phosphoribosyltransferase